MCTGLRCFLSCLLMATIACLGGCAGEVPEASTKRIIILTNGASPYWGACSKGAEDAAKELKLEEAGFKFEIQINDFSDQGQIDKLKSYLTAGDIAGVAISVTDEKNVAIVKAMEELREEGIHVITVDADVNPESTSARRAYIGTDNVSAGRELGIAAKAFVSDGEYMAFVGLKGSANAQGRTQGFQEGAGDGLKRTQYLEDKNSDRAAEIVTGILSANLADPPELLLGIWSYNTPAIVETVEKLGLEDTTTIVGFDAEPNTIEYLKQGKVDAVLVQNPYEMGRLSVKLLKALAEDDSATVEKMLPAETDTITTDLKIVVPDGETPLKSEMFDSNTKFMSLSEFQKWLDERTLSGS